MPQKKSRYLRPTAYFVRRIAISYSIKNNERILALFPTDSKKLAFKETCKHVSTLISCLKSEITPKNLSRRIITKRIQGFHDSLVAFERNLKDLLDSPTAPATVKIKSSLYKIRDFAYAENSLKQMQAYLLTTRWACERALNDVGIPGKKNHHFYIAVEHLANVWEKYTNKKATLINTNPSKGPQKPSGKFYEYIKLSIDSALRSNHIRLKISWENIIKEVLRARVSMEKISRK